MKKKIFCMLLITGLIFTGCGASATNGTEITDLTYAGTTLADSELYKISVDINYGIYSSDKVFDFIHDLIPVYQISQDDTILNIKFTKDEIKAWNETTSQIVFDGIRVDGMNIYVSSGLDTAFVEKMADMITILKINSQLQGTDDVVHIYLEGCDQAAMSF